MVTLAKHVNPGLVYIVRGPWHLGDFCNVFLPNISEDQKKLYHLNAGPWHQRYQSLLSIGGEGIICNVTPMLAYFQHWGMNFDQDFFQVSELSENQKKVFSKNGTLFFPEFNWAPALRCTPDSNYWEGCRCTPYSNYWGDAVKLLGGIYSPHRVSVPLPGTVPHGKYGAGYCIKFIKSWDEGLR